MEDDLAGEMRGGAAGAVGGVGTTPVRLRVFAAGTSSSSSLKGPGPVRRRLGAGACSLSLLISTGLSVDWPGLLDGPAPFPSVPGSSESSSSALEELSGAGAGAERLGVTGRCDLGIGRLPL